MARIYGINKRLAQFGINENLIKKINSDGDLINVIERMDESLDPETIIQLLDSCGCSGGKEYIKKCEKIGRELTGKALKEKIDYLNSEPDSTNLVLNDDNTITETMSFIDNRQYICVCSAAVKKGVKVSDLALGENDPNGRVMPLSYCFCCAGSGRRHLQLKLGIELKTKEIVSSPINSRGEKPCKIIYEMIQ